MLARYIGRRLLQLLPAVAAIVLLGFALVHLAPGDPILALAGEDGSAEYYAFMRQRYGLDRPFLVQLATYTGSVLTGDLGHSFVHGKPVASVIAERLPATLLLTGTALVISTVVGVALGVLAVRRRGGLGEVGVTVTALGLFASPVFWLGQLALILFALQLGWFPVQGISSPRSDPQGLAHLADVAHHLALPAVVLASQMLAAVTRMTHSSMLDELEQDYITTARAKGLSEWRVLVRHALRRALLPVATVIGARIGHLLSGSVVVEVVFGWPGVGRLLLSSIEARDRPLILGIFLLVAFSVVLANLITDIAYAWLDPRVRYR